MGWRAELLGPARPGLRVIDHVLLHDLPQLLEPLVPLGLLGGLDADAGCRAATEAGGDALARLGVVVGVRVEANPDQRLLAAVDPVVCLPLLVPLVRAEVEPVRRLVDLDDDVVRADADAVGGRLACMRERRVSFSNRFQSYASTRGPLR